MRKWKKYITAFALCLVMLFGSVAFVGCGKAADGTYYVVSYDLNYDGGGTRSMHMPVGAEVADWKATREGYNLTGWYSDAGATKAYDFGKKLDKDLTLYAGWREKPGVAAVTFDFGCRGAVNRTIETEKEKTIDTRYIPAHERLGMNFTSWYTDTARTARWDFTADKVTESMTLYAGYEFDPRFVARDGQGNIVYENVNVQVWNALAWFLPHAKLEKLAEDFNAQYEGKINVNVVSEFTTQEAVMLRLQQTPELMTSIDNYYSIADVFDAAGIEFTYDDWYAGASKESVKGGVMMQLPMAGIAPYIVYNKTLMKKYNGDRPLPQNYTQLSRLLREAYAGESGGNENFAALVSTRDWTFKEAPSFVAFMQNDAPYYRYDGKNGFYNDWIDPAVKARAETAMTNTYNLFGADGADHGNATYSWDGAAIDAVKKGNALMAMTSWRDAASIVAGDSELDVMPVSGLFTDETGAAAMSVPVHTMGFAFYKHASSVNSAQMCAAALFADYVVKNAYVFAEDAFVPLHRSAAENAAYADSENAVVKLLRTVCNPEYFVTLDGNKNLKPIVNTTVAEGFLLPMLSDEAPNVAALTETLRVQVTGQVY